MTNEPEKGVVIRRIFFPFLLLSYTYYLPDIQFGKKNLGIWKSIFQDKYSIVVPTLVDKLDIGTWILAEKLKIR